MQVLLCQGFGAVPAVEGTGWRMISFPALTQGEATSASNRPTWRTLHGQRYVRNPHHPTGGTELVLTYITRQRDPRALVAWM